MSSRNILFAYSFVLSVETQVKVALEFSWNAFLYFGQRRQPTVENTESSAYQPSATWQVAKVEVALKCSWDVFLYSGQRCQPTVDNIKVCGFNINFVPFEFSLILIIKSLHSILYPAYAVVLRLHQPWSISDFSLLCIFSTAKRCS